MEMKQDDAYSQFFMKDDDGIYYESQELKTDTCFQHAFNMYFQKEYITSLQFKSMYCKLLLKYKEKIFKIKQLNCKLSFYGPDIDIPSPKQLIDESSKIETNSDLNGYYELYAMSGIQDMVESFNMNNFKQLSPYDALFLLEFQMDLTTNKLKYVPHRIYHRLPRSKNVNDQKYSKQLFINALKSNKDKIESIYLARINRKGLSHAFAAIKNKKNKKWMLMDSLLKKYGYIKDENEMINKEEYLGQASVMIFKDSTRNSIDLDQYEIVDNDQQKNESV